MLRPAQIGGFDRLRVLLVAAMMAAGGMPASAQDGGLHPIDSALEMLNLKTRAGAMPDFVNQSRGSQAEDGYIPIGAKPPTRVLKPKSAADVRALTAELDAAREAQVADKRPKPMGTAATGKPVPKPRAKSRQATNH